MRRHKRAGRPRGAITQHGCAKEAAWRRKTMVSQQEQTRAPHNGYGPTAQPDLTTTQLENSDITLHTCRRPTAATETRPAPRRPPPPFAHSRPTAHEVAADAGRSRKRARTTRRHLGCSPSLPPPLPSPPPKRPSPSPVEPQVRVCVPRTGRRRKENTHLSTELFKAGARPRGSRATAIAHLNVWLLWGRKRGERKHTKTRTTT